ncbi:hypothetical protein [Leptospira stimsonii]|uniref:Galactose oxidase n=1 Tax=Leptospira stimsonii TaxID=2202203 RepID=A0A8B3CMC5_9LEPT|nr:hypothetical protein [Leptospira stimsonii]RHX84492.1 hypothetical protein DLM78_17370 [Leptospira stimsonii]
MIRKMNASISVSIFLLCSVSCAEAHKFSFDSSNPSAIIGQIAWSLASLNTEKYPFVATGESCASWYSLDGNDWSYSSTRFPSCNGGAIRSVAYGNKTWVAVGTLSPGSGCGLWSSKDGESWTRSTCANNGGGNSNFQLYSVTFGNGTFWVGGEKEGAGTSVPFYGLKSTDGVSWQYFPIDTGGANNTPDSANTASFDGVHSMVYFGFTNSVTGNISKYDSDKGTWSQNGDGDILPNIPSSMKKVFALKSGNVISYGDDANGGGALSVFNGTLWGPQTSTTTSTRINTIAEGADRIFVFGNVCTLDYTSDPSGLSGWIGFSGTPIEVGGCLGLHWTAATYNVGLKLFALGSTGTGASNPSTFAVSSTGSPNDWKLIPITQSGIPGPSVLSIAAKTH